MYIILFIFSPSSSDESADEAKAEALLNLDVSDIHSVDVESSYFKSLPTHVKYELLTELKERRKQNSWNKMSEMPQNADGFSNFQLERLRRRKRVQTTFESVGKTLGEETANDLDASLFVGDREGLKRAKKETRRVISSKEGHYSLLVSGIQGPSSMNEELVGEGNSTKKYEIRELISDCEDDVEEVKSFHDRVAEGEEVSQEEILRIIQSSNLDRTPISVLSDDGDSDIEIIEPSVKLNSSNRLGGKASVSITGNPSMPSTSGINIYKQLQIKGESKEKTEQVYKKAVSKSEDVLQIKINTDVELMSSSGSDSDGEDLFADVFKDNSENCENLEKLVTASSVNPSTIKGQNRAKSENTKILEQAAKFDSTEDVFADVFRQTRKLTVPEEGDVVRVESKSSDGSCLVNKEIAETMKKSEHLWLKLASKWADGYGEKKPTVCAKEKLTSGKPAMSDSLSKIRNDLQKKNFEEEEAKLLKEMREKEKEGRLLKIKSTQLIQETPATKKLALPGAVSSSESSVEKVAVNNDELSILKDMGVKVVDKKELEKQVREDEGWKDDDKKTPVESSSIIYGNAAPGFILSKKYDVVSTPVIDLDCERSKNEPNELLDRAVEKLNEEDGETSLSQSELIALQVFGVKEPRI